MKPVIHPLSPELTERFFDFFDHRAFVDNPDWAGCYCTLYHFPGFQEAWEKRPGEQNRLEAARLIERGSLTGYLAFDGEKPIGWCNVNLKSAFPFLKNYPRLETDDDDSTASVVCFTVDPGGQLRGPFKALRKARLFRLSRIRRYHHHEKKSGKMIKLG